jgi:hypothetical protein
MTIMVTTKVSNGERLLNARIDRAKAMCPRSLHFFFQIHTTMGSMPIEIFLYFHSNIFIIYSLKFLDILKV